LPLTFLKKKLLADTFWPGPSNLIKRRQSTIPDLVTAGKDTVFEYLIPVTLALLEQLNFPLAAKCKSLWLNFHESGACSELFYQVLADRFRRWRMSNRVYDNWF
jgi:hypothetical protein